MEIGGYFELDKYGGREYHSGAVALNCCRNAIAYIVEARQYRKVYIPSFCCDSVCSGVKKGGGDYELYDVDNLLHPLFAGEMEPNEAILIVNYYGQLSNDELLAYKRKWGNVIVDNTQSFFKAPLHGIDTVYSCRKFFGVADGAYLVTDACIDRAIETDVSAQRMLFVMGRYDEGAAAYYENASSNNEFFEGESIKYMSKLTHNLLRRIDYELVKEKRRTNVEYLHKYLNNINRLNYKAVDGAFMYPLWYEKGKGEYLRKYLQKKGVFVPCLWPDVLVRQSSSSLAYQLADDIIPLPCDQRYGIEEMKYILKTIEEFASTELRNV